MIEIKIDQIVTGSADGKQVWICDYRRPDLSKKPIRNIAPILVEVVSNSKLPKNKVIYYSDSHFRPVGKKGLTKKIIPVYDNTGFRLYPGVPLRVFIEFEDCMTHYKNCVMDVVGRLSAERDAAVGKWQSQINDLLSMITQG